MKYIKKLWVRIIISLLMGGVLVELINVTLGTIPEQSSGLMVLIGAGLTFGFLSLIVWFDKYRYYYFPDKTKEEEDVLDDFE